MTQECIHCKGTGQVPKNPIDVNRLGEQFYIRGRGYIFLYDNHDRSLPDTPQGATFVWRDQTYRIVSYECFSHSLANVGLICTKVDNNPDL